MLALQFKCDLQGVDQFEIKDSLTEPYFFTFKVECASCREIHANAVGFNAHEKVALQNSRGEANFAMKCKSCGKDGNINVEPKYGVYTSDNNKPVTMAKFDCRGLELVEFIPDGTFTAKNTENGATFDVKFDDGEWYDYDEKAGEEVSITAIEWSIVKTK